MEDVLAVRDNYRMEQWAQIIQECQQSGLTNRAFCMQHHISEKSYYYWLRKLRNAAASSQPHLVQLDGCPAEEQQSDRLSIQFHGARLELPSTIDMEAVAALLRSLQQL